MFENIGGKLKSLAWVVFGLELIGVALLAVALSDMANNFNFLTFALVIVGGIITSCLSVMMLYAFGELVENSAIISRNVGKILASNSSNEAEDTSYYTLLKRPANADFWICPNCRTSNHKTAGSCGCGTRKPY